VILSIDEGGETGAAEVSEPIIKKGKFAIT
jgi:hypothetical protein